MTTREKIIVAAMVLAVVYGVYVVFFEKPREAAPVASAERELEALNTFITNVAEKTKTGLSRQQSYVLQKAQAAWKQDPMIQIQAKKSNTNEEEKMPAMSQSKIRYTGFLQMGDKRMAIINGMEYEAGDKLEPGGFTLRRVNPNHVVLAPPGTEKKTFILPMEEIE